MVTGSNQNIRGLRKAMRLEIVKMSIFWPKTSKTPEATLPRGYRFLYSVRLTGFQHVWPRESTSLTKYRA